MSKFKTHTGTDITKDGKMGGNCETCWVGRIET